MPDARIWLRTRRAALDQTQTDAADAVGVSRHTFARWEGGDLLPGLVLAARLARWAECTIDEVAQAFGLVDDAPEFNETPAEEADRLLDATP